MYKNKTTKNCSSFALRSPYKHRARLFYYLNLNIQTGDMSYWYTRPYEIEKVIYFI